MTTPPAHDDQHRTAAHSADPSHAGAYAATGVDLDAADQAKRMMRSAAQATHGPHVLAGLGGFGGLFALDATGMREPVLVSSIDGVGTKLKLAFALDRHDTIGADLVAHCVNDILVCGARPLFFLDYLALGAMDATRAAAVVAGVAAGCVAAGCALVGGETAAMPGFYAPGEYDLAGCIIGIVDRPELVTGAAIAAGDAVIGLPSLGLHTNGYSLARSVLAHLDLHVVVPPLHHALGDELLQPHQCYLDAVRPLLGTGQVTGMAHITGGGLVDNLPRVLPEYLCVRLDASTWDVLPIFRLIQAAGMIEWAEMLRVFNLGLGYIIFCHERDADAVLAHTAPHGGRRVGQVVPRAGDAARVIVEGLV